MPDTFYNSQQFVGSTPLSWTALECRQYPANYEDDVVDYQQWIIYNGNSTKFVQGSSYVVKFSIQQNKNYNLVYGLRLLNLPSDGGNLSFREDTKYEFIKYITIPAIDDTKIPESIVWLYEEDSIVNAAVAIEVDSANQIEQNLKNALKFFFHYQRDNNNNKTTEIDWIYRCDNEGNIIENNGTPVDYKNKIKFNSNLMLHNFDSEENLNTMDCYFVFTPTRASWDAIYFCLKLIPEDEEIRWSYIDGTTGNSATLRGRHTTISNASYASLENLIDRLNGNNEVVNIGVWGRSEQLMAINGQEIKIGPSGYFELKDFNVNSLCIANTQTDDKYIVDIQYKPIADSEEEN